MELKDVIHFYLGCLVRVKRNLDTEYNIGRICEVTKNSNHGDWIDVRFDTVIEVTGRTFEKSNSNFHDFFIGEDHIQLVLRRLSDMTEEELKEIRLIMAEYENLRFKSDEKDVIKYTNCFIYDEVNEYGDHISNITSSPDNLPAKSVPWFTKRGFDIFNLIRLGQAIDAKTLQP